MPKYRSTHVRTEEEKRKLKVDLSKVPELEAELASIAENYLRFDFDQVADAVTLIQNVHIMLSEFKFDVDRICHYDKIVYKCQFQDYYKEDYLADFNNWKNKWLAAGHSYYPPLTFEKGQDFIESIQFYLKHNEEKLGRIKVNGVTDRFWVTCVTSKTLTSEM